MEIDESEAIAIAETLTWTGPSNISVSDSVTFAEYVLVDDLTYVLLDIALTDSAVSGASLSDATVSDVALSDVSRT